MNHNSKTSFGSEFMDILMAANEEAERVGLDTIYDIFVLKSLIYSSNSHLKDILNDANVSINDVDTAIRNQITLYIEENNIRKDEENNKEEVKEDESQDDKPKERIHTGSDLIDWELIINFVNLSIETEDTISNSIYYSYDGAYIGEAEYMLSLLEESKNPYIEGFFRLININSRLVLRCYEGIMAEQNTSFMYGDNDYNYEYDEDNEDDDDDDIPVYEVEDKLLISDNKQEEEENSNLEIPLSVRSFLDFVYVDAAKPSPIRGRDKETQAVMQVLLKSKKSNVVLVGQPGVGKTAIIEHLTWLIETEKCPEELIGKCVVSLDVNALIAGAKYVGMAEQRFTELIKFLKKQKDVILFIDEIHTIVGAGASVDNTLDLSNALKPLLARGEIAVIGATTNQEYENWMSKDKALKRRFERIEIREPEYSEVHSMVKQQVANLQEFHGVKIDNRVLDYIIKVAGCFNTETANPDRTLDMVDRAMVTAKMKGKKTVTMNIAMNNFDANFKAFAKMSDELKYQTALHELGHYLVRRYSKHLAVEKALAISIIPAEDYLGITVSDAANHSIINWTSKAHLEHIAICLGGRVAEKMYCKEYSSGASADLKEATKEAKRMIIEYGLASEFTERNIEEDRSEKQTEELNYQVDRIIKNGYELAEKILKEHEDVLKELAKILCNKGILVGNDLENICRKVEKRNGK